LILRTLAALVFVSVLPVRADLTAAAKYSQRRAESALIVWQNGRIVLNRQAREGAPANIFSITKSLAALGTLHAVGRGVLRLDERVSDTLTEWKADPHKRRITVRELLSQTSGLSPGYETLYARGVRDKSALVLKLPAVAAPGDRFAYGPSHYEALAALLARKVPPAETWLTIPFTGVHPAGLRRDRSGQPFFSAGARLSPRQLLDLGHFVRRNGWAFIFPVVPSPLIKEAATGSPANPMYGLGLWLNHQAIHSSAVERDVEEALAAGLGRAAWSRSCLSRHAPPDLVAMVGSRGQRVYIVPSRRQIIVRLGNSSGFRDPDFLRAFYR
jgi:CubicO group peptidase (beta-lactamase class C family)